MNSEPDKEIKAISSIIQSLESLSEEEKKRVLNYVCERTNLKECVSVGSKSPINLSTKDEEVKKDPLLGSKLIDIRTLKAEKSPKTQIQMAVLVAYYLQECAPVEKRQDYVTEDDIIEYFKQSGSNLPTGKARFTLTNAKNAGYLESIGNGQYKLNPVGYNLVAYNLPGVNSSNSVNKSTKKREKKNKQKIKKNRNSKK